MRRILACLAGNPLDQLLLRLVVNEHPEWRKPDGSCPACWLEVERLRAEMRDDRPADA